MFSIGEDIGKEPDPEKMKKLIALKKEELNRLQLNVTKK